MPYIDQNSRDRVEITGTPNNAGELNYMITMLIQRYIDTKSGYNYQLLNDAMGALEGAKLEMYRRVAGPYEDDKAIENGDAFYVKPKGAY